MRLSTDATVQGPGHGASFSMVDGASAFDGPPQWVSGFHLAVAVEHIATLMGKGGDYIQHPHLVVAPTKPCCEKLALGMFV